jgi:hypothetical protein
MDVTKQMQDAIKTWTSSQRRIIDEVTKVVTDITTPPAANPWETSLDLWKKGVSGFLETQENWSALLVQGVDIATNRDDRSPEWTKRVSELTKLQLELEQKSWETWFAILEQIDPIENANFLKELQPLTETWSENLHRAIELQDEWLQAAINVGKGTANAVEDAAKPIADMVKPTKAKKQPA